MTTHDSTALGQKAPAGVGPLQLSAAQTLLLLTPCPELCFSHPDPPWDSLVLLTATQLIRKPALFHTAQEESGYAAQAA